MRRPEIKHPAEGKLQLFVIHSPKCSACKQTDRAMELWDYYHPEAPVKFYEKERLGVDEIMNNYLHVKQNGLTMKSLPTFFISWSERPRTVLWWTTGGVDSKNPSQVDDLYREIEEAFEKARKEVNDGIKKGIF